MWTQKYIEFDRRIHSAQPFPLSFKLSVFTSIPNSAKQRQRTIPFKPSNSQSAHHYITLYAKTRWWSWENSLERKTAPQADWFLLKCQWLQLQRGCFECVTILNIPGRSFLHFSWTFVATTMVFDYGISQPNPPAVNADVARGTFFFKHATTLWGPEALRIQLQPPWKKHGESAGMAAVQSVLEKRSIHHQVVPFCYASRRHSSPYPHFRYISTELRCESPLKVTASGRDIITSMLHALRSLWE